MVVLAQSLFLCTDCHLVAKKRTATLTLSHPFSLTMSNVSWPHPEVGCSNLWVTTGWLLTQTDWTSCSLLDVRMPKWLCWPHKAFILNKSVAFTHNPHIPFLFKASKQMRKLHPNSPPTHTDITKINMLQLQGFLCIWYKVRHAKDMMQCLVLQTCP